MKVMRSAVLRTLFVALGMALLLVFALKPKVGLPSLYEIAVVVAIQVIAITGARFLVRDGPGNLLVKALISAFLFAALVVFVLQPSIALGFDNTFLIVVGIEFGGMAAAGILTRGGS